MQTQLLIGGRLVAGEPAAQPECRARIAQHRASPQAAALNDEMPSIADVFRFFAGACRSPQGLAAGEYLPGHTSMMVKL